MTSVVVGTTNARFLHNRVVQMVGTEGHRFITVSYYGVLSSLIDCTGVSDEEIWQRFIARPFDLFG